jgi:hypothetical protein
MEKCWVFIMLKHMVLVFTTVLKWVNESIRDLLSIAAVGSTAAL